MDQDINTKPPGVVVSLDEMRLKSQKAIAEGTSVEEVNQEEEDGELEYGHPIEFVCAECGHNEYNVMGAEGYPAVSLYCTKCDAPVERLLFWELDEE